MGGPTISLLAPKPGRRQSKLCHNEFSAKANGAKMRSALISAKLLDVDPHNLNSILISAEPKARFQNNFARRVT
jgi:hypothetical protein